MLSAKQEKRLQQLRRGAAIPRDLPAQAVTQKSSVQINLTEGSCFGFFFPGSTSRIYGYVITTDSFSNPLSYEVLLYPSNSADVGAALNPVCAEFTVCAATQSSTSAIVGGYSNSAIPTAPFIQSYTRSGTYESPLAMANADRTLCGQPIYDGFINTWFGVDPYFTTINNEVEGNELNRGTNMSLSENRGNHDVDYQYSVDLTGTTNSVGSIDSEFSASSIDGPILPVLSLDSCVISGEVHFPQLAYNNTGFYADVIYAVRIRGYNPFGDTIFNHIQYVGTYTSPPPPIIPGEQNIPAMGFPFTVPINQSNISGSPDILTMIQVDTAIMNTSVGDIPLTIPVSPNYRLNVLCHGTNREGVNRGYTAFAIRGVPDGNDVNINATRWFMMQFDETTTVFVGPTKQKFKPFLREALLRILNSPGDYAYKHLFARSMGQNFLQHFAAALSFESTVEKEDYDEAAVEVHNLLRELPFQDVEYEGTIATPVQMSMNGIFKRAKRLYKKVSPHVAKALRPVADLGKQVVRDNIQKFKDDGLFMSSIDLPGVSVGIPNPLAEFVPRKSDGSHPNLREQVNQLTLGGVKTATQPRLVFLPRSARMSTNSIGASRLRIQEAPKVAAKEEFEKSEDREPIPFTVGVGKFVIMPGILKSIVKIGRAEIGEVDTSNLWAVVPADAVPPKERSKYKVVTPVSGKKLYGWRSSESATRNGMSFIQDMAVVRLLSRPNIKQISVSVPTEIIEDRSLELALRMFPCATTAAFSGALRGSMVESLPPDVAMAKKSVCQANGIPLVANSPLADYKVTTVLEAFHVINTVRLQTEVAISEEPVATVFNRPDSSEWPKPTLSLPLKWAVESLNIALCEGLFEAHSGDEDHITGFETALAECLTGILPGKRKELVRAIVLLRETNQFYEGLFPKTPIDLNSDMTDLVFYTFYFYCFLNAVKGCDFTRSSPTRTFTDILDLQPDLKMTFVESGTLYVAYKFKGEILPSVFSAETLVHKGFLSPSFENMNIVYMATLSSDEIAKLKELLHKVDLPDSSDQPRPRRRRPPAVPDDRSRQATYRANRRQRRNDAKTLARQDFQVFLNSMPKDANPKKFALFPWASAELLEMLPDSVNLGNQKSFADLLTALTKYGVSKELIQPAVQTDAD